MEYNYSDELRHYGVLGMKWGVRRGRTDKVYAKASRKLEKLDAKATKYQKKAIKNAQKADEKFYNREAYSETARRANRKALKTMKKAEKMVKNMDKAFANTTINLTKTQRDIGRRYVESLNIRANTYRYN